jgi:YfiR/HmsC-like
MAILSRRPTGLRRVLLHTLIPLSLYLSPAAYAAEAQASASETLEYGVKAAYLLNFSRYVQWPTAAFTVANAPIRICVLGEDPFGATLPRTVARQTTQGRGIESLQVSTPENAIASYCQVLYIGSDQRRARHWQDQLRGHPIVTVGEGDDFLEEGGMIGFVLIDETIRFAISLPALHAGGLQISSRVLSLATRVIPDPGRS